MAAAWTPLALAGQVMLQWIERIPELIAHLWVEGSALVPPSSLRWMFAGPQVSVCGELQGGGVLTFASAHASLEMCLALMHYESGHPDCPSSELIVSQILSENASKPVRRIRIDCHRPKEGKGKMQLTH